MDSEAMIFFTFNQFLRKPLRLPAKNEEQFFLRIAVINVGIIIVAVIFNIIERSIAIVAVKFLHRIVFMDRNMLPIIEPSSFQHFIIRRKSQWMNQMQ